MTSLEYWVVRVIVVRRDDGAMMQREARTWRDPVTGDEPSEAQRSVIWERLASETYYSLAGIGIVEPVEHSANEDTGRERMLALQAKHPNERFALVLTVA